MATLAAGKKRLLKVQQQRIKQKQKEQSLKTKKTNNVPDGLRTLGHRRENGARETDGSKLLKQSNGCLHHNEIQEVSQANEPYDEVTSHFSNSDSLVPNDNIVSPNSSSVRNKNVVFVYNEDDKTSREVFQPDDCHIALSVLVKYELTAETLKHQKQKEQKHRDETTLNQNYDKNEDITTPKCVVPIRERDILNHDENQNEIKNKGLHVMKWLTDLREPDGKAQPEGLQRDGRHGGEVVSEHTQNND